MKRIELIRPIMGICHSQACAEKDVPREEIERFANETNPSGTTNGWHIADDHGEPVVCADDANRLHWLLVC